MAQSIPREAIAYFTAKNAHDIGGMLASFHEDAFVIDEGERLVGHSVIREWMEATTRKYRVHVEILGSTEEEGRTNIEGLVSGEFPGSPATLSYGFTFQDGKIASLEIL